MLLAPGFERTVFGWTLSEKGGLSQKKFADGGGDLDFLLLVQRFIKLTFFSLHSFLSLADFSLVAVLCIGPFGGVLRVAATRL